MTQRLLLVSLILFSLLGAAGAGTCAQVDAAAGPKQVIVHLKPGADKTRFAQKHGTPILDGDPDNQSLLVQISGQYERESATIAMDPIVSWVELNVDLGLDLNAQWTTAFDGDGGPRHYAGQLALPQVNDVTAPALADGSGVTVAVLDTGISLRHPLLAGKVLTGWNFIDNNANTDDIPLTPPDRQGTAEPAVGHGTAVAGMVAVIAPGARLLPVKVLNSSGQGTIWGLCQGIKFALARDARVLNISVSTPVRSKLLDQTIRDAYAAGALVVASAGNENSDDPRYPAANPHVMGVAALTNDNVKAPFSNFGPSVDVAAPGVDVITTFWDGTFVQWSGTSFSAPIVSGQAALLFSLVPVMDGKDVGRLIETTSHSVDDWNPGFAGQLGHGNAGLVDIDASVAAAQKLLQIPGQLLN